MDGGRQPSSRAVYLVLASDAMCRSLSPVSGCTCPSAATPGDMDDAGEA